MRTQRLERCHFCSTKVCIRCQQEKDRSEFYTYPKSSDGLRGHCKACHALPGRKRAGLGDPTTWIEGRDYLVQDRGFTTPCWIWQRTAKRTGYGRVIRDGRDLLAHRVSFEHANGRTPVGDVHHRCEQRACVNPEHLEEHERADHIRIHTSSRRRLTNDQVLEIRRLRSEGMSFSELGRRFGMCTESMSLVAKGRIYADVT